MVFYQDHLQEYPQIMRKRYLTLGIFGALNFYDLLGQQSNYERWVNATGRSDTTTRNGVTKTSGADD